MNAPDAETDFWRDLATRALKGNKRDYNTLLKAIAELSYKILINSVSCRDWVDDIVQDILISVHKSLHTYSPDRPFRPWLMAIIAYRRTDFLRKHYAARSHLKTDVENPDFLKSHVTKMDHAGEYKDMQAALFRLPEKQRTVFIMTKIEGYSIEEVALKMQMSQSAVKVTAHRAQNKLKEIL